MPVSVFFWSKSKADVSKGLIAYGKTAADWGEERSPPLLRLSFSTIVPRYIEDVNLLVAVAT
ncbi:hypothetical protein BBO01nite_04190 [Brevibacillus borstelensis]|nr:hypothetical protein BBO01nite_04190 [Brevibacillus borstelensis]